MILYPRLVQAKSEINLLEQKLEAQQLETEKHSKQAEEVNKPDLPLLVTCTLSQYKPLKQERVHKP